MELDKRSARILGGHVGQALSEHVFVCAQDGRHQRHRCDRCHGTRRLLNATTRSVTRSLKLHFGIGPLDVAVEIIWRQFGQGLRHST